MTEVELDRDSCTGVFACLVRDQRFVEDDDGLAAFHPDLDAVTRSPGDGEGDADVVVATVKDDLSSMRKAAEACPFDAIEIMEDG